MWLDLLVASGIGLPAMVYGSVLFLNYIMKSCYNPPTLERQRKAQRQNRRQPIRELHLEAFSGSLELAGAYCFPIPRKLP